MRNGRTRPDLWRATAPLVSWVASQWPVASGEAVWQGRTDPCLDGGGEDARVEARGCGAAAHVEEDGGRCDAAWWGLCGTLLGAERLLVAIQVQERRVWWRHGRHKTVVKGSVTKEFRRFSGLASDNPEVRHFQNLEPGADVRLLVRLPSE